MNDGIQNPLYGSRSQYNPLYEKPSEKQVWNNPREGLFPKEASKPPKVFHPKKGVKSCEKGLRQTFLGGIYKALSALSGKSEKNEEPIVWARNTDLSIKNKNDLVEVKNPELDVKSKKEKKDTYEVYGGYNRNKQVELHYSEDTANIFWEELQANFKGDV